MSYSSWHNDWNKLVRDKIPSSLEAKGIKTTIRIVTDKNELITLLWDKLYEELEEFNVVLEQQVIDKIAEEAADVQEVLDALKELLTWNIDTIKNYDAVVGAMWRADWHIKTRLADVDPDLLIQKKVIQKKKFDEKWWFQAWIFLISTDW